MSGARKRPRGAEYFHNKSLQSNDQNVNLNRHFACDRKGGYVSERQAQIRADKSTEISGKRMRVYKCEFCDNWHLSHKKKVRKTDPQGKSYWDYV